MKVNDIELHTKSRLYLEGVFERYSKKEEIPDSFIGRVVIHLYPTSDTYDKEGNLNGFRDSLFFTAKIYEIFNKNVYTLKNRDGLEIRANCETRIFKDGSTMIFFDGPIKILTSQRLLIKPA